MTSFPNFNALRDLHNSANDLLHLPEIQQVLVNKEQEKWVNEVCESSVTMLDVCGISRDVLLLVKQHLLDLQFTIRRKIFSEPNINAKKAKYNSYRKKLKKETLKCLRSLNRMKNKSDMFNIDPKLVVVVEMLREVRVTTISIVESLLSLISIPWLDQKSSKTCSLIKSKFFTRSSRRNDDLSYEFCDQTALHSANKRLEAVEIAIEDLEMELECIFRRLIQTRVSLLNILTN